MIPASIGTVDGPIKLATDDPVAILGAGSVGVFLAAHLARTGTPVTLLARRAEQPTLSFELVADRDERAQSLTLPVQSVSTARLPTVGTLLVCVRSDQVEEAVASAARVAPAAALGLVASVSAAQLLALRAHHPGRALYTVMPMFNCWATDAHTFRWLQPPIVKTLLSGEGDPAADVAVRHVCAQLLAGGLRARVVASAVAATLTFYTAGMPMLAGWELGGWGPQFIPSSARRLTATAIRDSFRAKTEARELPARRLSSVPSWHVALGGGLGRLFIGRATLAMWRHHGPKIAAQTRAMLDAVLARARQGDVATPGLRALRERLDASSSSGDVGGA